MFSSNIIFHRKSPAGPVLATENTPSSRRWYLNVRRAEHHDRTSFIRRPAFDFGDDCINAVVLNFQSMNLRQSDETNQRTGARAIILIVCDVI